MGPRSISLFGLVLASTLATPVAGYDRAIMHHYTAQPPFTSDRVTKPNVLLVMDTSGSMQRPASQQVDGGQGVGIWSETFRYAGMFDPMRCSTLRLESCPRVSWAAAWIACRPLVELLVTDNPV